MGTTASTPSSPSASSPAATCPVDHKTRDIWLRQHAASNHTDEKPREKQQRSLSTDREISSIPRALGPGHNEQQIAQTSLPLAASHGTPSNAETETGHDQSTGNWVYPSERQFFEALMRKGNVPASMTSAKDLATSVASVIPIHNAVNERAWQQILEWEGRAPASDPGSKKCGGPRLYAFRGLGVESQFLSPRARLNGLLGYQLPFDRHDWIVERCGGERVEYVIDFYQGRSSSVDPNARTLAANANPAKLSFYLDVRPKLNTWEGWRMRASRILGQ